ncbi:uncharacterized protein A4U43_C01F21040 [Asparagus officinalis]|uniref:Glycosyltransferase n=1 Tax=Asparagus officinalis TaxID=4686 RepID=A0A5P1FQY9_ASPOF|nr:UDP-glycosyltransferase 73C6-like [Asparagus officinalis]ONK80725.1 uncharacterized protein A4U43_C01F21040 [Asparagus officinalis]
MTIQIPCNVSDTKPHFVLVPLMAQGHMIPMIDIARLLASHGAIVTLITTPANAARISTTIDKIERAGLPVNFVPLKFPSAEVGLPEGLENIDMLPSRDQLKNFFDAICMLRDPLILHLRAYKPLPTCIISDNIHYWTRDVAKEFNIPRLTFHGMGCFALLCIKNVRDHEIEAKIIDGNETFVVPGLPMRIEIMRAQVPGFFSMPSMDKHREELRATELASDGVVVNSFDDLETIYHDQYQSAIGKKVWNIGPLSLYNGDVVDVTARGNKASIDEERCLMWLDSMKPSSVVYVSFGSLARTIPSQLIEIGLALEASNCPFIWVIKAGERFSEVQEWLSEFEKRTRNRGLIIRGWAPQVMILSHLAVGGFMTHCGWNSTLESISAGVPMITWPHFAEQFLNEKMIVEVLKIGISVGVKIPTIWGMDTDDVSVKKEDVEKAVRSLFEGDEAEKRRQRAKEFAEKAQKTVEEGGSSYANLTHLVQYIKARTA